VALHRVHPGACCTACCEAPAPGTDAGRLPPRPSASAASATTATVFAISKLYFGDLDQAGQPSTTAWKTYGLNIDGKVTAENSTNVCTRIEDAICETQLDGDNGIDNSFGENVVPVIETLSAMFSSYVNQQIQQGGGTLLLQLDGLGSSDSYAPLPGALYRAMPTPQPPRWDGTDVRNVDTVSLIGGDISKPIALLPNGYMNDRVWVGGLASGTVYFDLQVTSDNGGVGLMPPLPLQHVQVAMHVASGNGSAASGTLSAVARAQDVVAWLQLFAGTISTSLCSGAAFQSIASQFDQMSDIMANGTNEPGQPCDAISVGAGFDAVAVQLGKAETEPPVVNPCEDGGVVDAALDGG
jgi:hypothetical protein